MNEDKKTIIRKGRIEMYWYHAVPRVHLYIGLGWSFYSVAIKSRDIGTRPRIKLTKDEVKWLKHFEQLERIYSNHTTGSYTFNHQCIIQYIKREHERNKNVL